MRAVVQRVKNASVTIENELYSRIDVGILVLVGITVDDMPKDIQYIVDKCLNLRIFEDENGVMNRCVQDVNGEVLVVSQFTLYGDARGGRRPSYIKAAKPQDARTVFEECTACFEDKYNQIKTGKFQAMMDVTLVNDGPVTILLDSKKEF
ncbi:MAG: D-aminoacyl-tRNA deacylase [Christensenellaceae bacterium]